MFHLCWLILRIHYAIYSIYPVLSLSVGFHTEKQLFFVDNAWPHAKNNSLTLVVIKFFEGFLH